MRVRDDCLLFLFLPFMVVVPLFHHLMEKEYIYLVKSKGVSKHQNGRNKEENIQQTSQETQIVQRGEKDPVGRLNLVQMIIIPVRDDFGVFLGRCCVRILIIHVVLPVGLLLRFLKRSKLQVLHLFFPSLVRSLHIRVFEGDSGGGDGDALPVEISRPLRVKLMHLYRFYQ